MSGVQYWEPRGLVGLVMVFFTIKRTRYLGKTVGVGCILVGLIVLSFMHVTGWQFQHVYSFASFAALPAIGFATIIFTRIRDATSVVERAATAGYKASEAEITCLEDGFREFGKLYLLVPPAYTIVWLLIICFILEPAGIFSLEIVFLSFVVFTWSVPILFIIFLAIPYSTDKRYHEARVLLRKSIEGARLMKRKRKLGETNPGDLRILKEEESSELETKRKEEPKKSKAKVK